MIEFALVAPLLIMVVVGGLILGIGQYRQIEMRTQAQQAVDMWAVGTLTETEAVAYAAEKASVVCAGSSHDECFVSGLPGTVEMRQMIVRGEELQLPFLGSVQPGAKLTGVTP